MWIDYAENIYQYGKCESISDEYSKTDADIERILPYFITFKVLSAIPMTIFSAFIVVSLTYRSMISAVDFCYSYSYKEKRVGLVSKGKDSFCCLVCNVDDEHEIIYSKYDLYYVMDLLKKHKEDDDEEENVKSENIDEIIDTKSFNKDHDYSRLKKIKKSKFMETLKKLGNFIYKWDTNFKFSSKYVNSVFVAVVALYYFVLFWGYYIITNITAWTLLLPNNPALIDLTNFDFGQLICQFSEDLCVQAISAYKFIMPFQRALNLLPNYKSYILAIAIVPIFGAFFIALLQMFIWVKESKNHLKQLYVGECEFVPKTKNLSNASIASASFHFGGQVI